LNINFTQEDKRAEDAKASGSIERDKNKEDDSTGDSGETKSRDQEKQKYDSSK